MRPWFACGLPLLLACGLASKAGAGEAEGKILSPVPHEVVQRQGFVPARAHEHAPGGPALGHALVPIVADFPAGAETRYEFRVVARDDAFGKGTEWAPLEDVRVAGRKLSGKARVPAGGWYRLEVRNVANANATATVEPIGVGELFLIAGQSYASGANDALLRVDDPEGRVVAFDLEEKSWRVANDPQPHQSDGGTIWPPMANALLPMVRVPIGLVNVASGGTATREWMPGTPLYNNLAKAGTAIGPFRAVLWQQGESDVIEKISTETYVARLQEIRSSLAKEIGSNPPWLLAKSTLHPTVYNDPVHEDQIRAAIDRLWSTPGFRPGPDTDILGGENRGGPKTRRHFSALGQERAGLLWFATIWHELQR